LFYDYTTLNGDEGIVLQGAQRILQGQVLYRDFFSFFTPGSYYWIALLFKIFGSSILVGRAALVVYGGVFSVLTYLLSRRVCSRWSALLAAFLVTIICLPFRFLVIHNWDSTLWAYLTVYCAVRFLEEPHWGWAAGVGSFTALTCLFEQSKGAGLVLGLTIGFAALILSNRCAGQFDRARIAALALGFIWPFLLTFAYFSTQHSLYQMLAGWMWPLHHYAGANTLPYGYLVLSTPNREALFEGPWTWRLFILLVTGPCLIVPALPAVALGVFVHKITQIWQRKPLSAKSGYYTLVSAILVGLLLGLLATRRPDFTHILYLAPLLCLVLAWAVDGQDWRWQSLKFLTPFLVLFVLFSFTAFGLSSLWGPLQAHYTLKTQRGVLKTTVPDTVLQYVQAYVPPGEKIFVYPYEPLYYYLTATFSPTRYEYLQPGMHSADQFQEAIRQVAADHTRVVLFELAFNEKIPWNFPSTPVGVLAQRDPVADYILANYKPCRGVTSSTSWRFVCMVRKDLTCPDRPETAQRP
jgi:hypothetical protein